MSKQNINIEERLLDYYDGRLQDTEREEVREWISASEENRRIARQVYSLLIAVDVQNVERKIDTEKALKKVKGRRITRKGNGNWWQWAQRAAAVLFIPLLSLFIWQQMRMVEDVSESEMIAVTTYPGMITKFKLPDGTLVCLNSETTLSYPARFTGDARSVYLSGEAYFEVEKDADHRFIVHTPGQSSVEVYGTRFNVEAYEDDSNVITTLAEGKVGFVYQNGHSKTRAFLAPGQKFVYNIDKKVLAKYTTSGISELSWKDGLIILENTPLPEVLRILENRFNVNFIVKNKKLNELHFTGSLSTQRLEMILKYFEISSRIHWKYLDDTEDKLTIEVY